MADIQSQIAQARAAGYSDDEIASKLATIPEYTARFKAAADAKYSPSEVVGYLSGGSRPSGPVSGSAAIPEAVPGARASITAAPPKAPEPSFLDKLKGAGEAAASLATGATGGALGYIGGALGGVAGSIASGEFGTEQGLRRAKEAAEQGAAGLTYQPRTAAGQQYVQNAAEAIENTGIQGLPIGPEFQALGAMARPAARQAATAIANSPEAYAAGNLARRVAETRILPTVDPEKAKLAQKAIDAGIQLTPDMLTDNKFAKILGETLNKIPLSGSRTDANQIAFNRQLGKLIGARANEKRLTDDVFADAMKRSGGTIGEISAKTDIPLDADLTGQLTSLVDDAARYETGDVGRIIGNYVDDLTAKAEANGGVIDGEAFRKINSKIGKQIRGTTDGDLRTALSDIQETMLDALQKNISSPEELQNLLDARKKYAIGKTIEPLVAKSVDGDISPAQLLGRVTATGLGKTNLAMGRAGELGDLAKIGQLLKEPGSSNTAERAAILAGLGVVGGGGVAAISPLAAAGTYTAANLYNRLSPLLSRRLVRNSLPGEVPAAQFGGPRELALADESAFRPAVAPQAAETPYTGLLSLAEENAPTQAGTPPLAQNPNYPSVEFPLRQEILQQPEIVQAVDAFRQEAARLQQIATNAISPQVRGKAARDLAQLQAEFAVGMKQLGIGSAAEATGINRQLYESGTGTALQITKTMDRVARQRAIAGIGQATTIDEAIAAASQQ